MPKHLMVGGCLTPFMTLAWVKILVMVLGWKGLIRLDLSVVYQLSKCWTAWELISLGLWVSHGPNVGQQEGIVTWGLPCPRDENEMKKSPRVGDARNGVAANFLEKIIRRIWIGKSPWLRSMWIIIGGHVLKYLEDTDYHGIWINIFGITFLISLFYAMWFIFDWMHQDDFEIRVRITYFQWLLYTLSYLILSIIYSLYHLQLLLPLLWETGASIVKVKDQGRFFSEKVDPSPRR